jgi:hypothetical protein
VVVIHDLHASEPMALSIPARSKSNEAAGCRLGSTEFGNGADRVKWRLSPYGNARQVGQNLKCSQRWHLDFVDSQVRANSARAYWRRKLIYKEFLTKTHDISSSAAIPRSGVLAGCVA